jgi:hypothetical protein
MTRFVFAVITILLATTSAVHAQPKLDEEAVHNLHKISVRLLTSMTATSSRRSWPTT